MDRTLALLNYTSIFCLLRKLNAVILVGINHYTTDEECTHSVLNKAACAVMNENLKPRYCVRLEELTPEVCCPELLYFSPESKFFLFPGLATNFCLCAIHMNLVGIRKNRAIFKFVLFSSG